MTQQPARSFDRLPPHDTDAEMCALASMMLAGDDKALFEETRRIIRDGGNLYSADHSILFDVMCQTVDAGGKIDAVILMAELKRRQLFDEVGGRDYLSQILDKIPSAAHGPHYASIVRELATLRGCIRVGNELIRSAYEPGIGDRSVAIAQDAVRDLASLASTGVSSRVHKLGDVVAEVYDGLSQKRTRRISTGLHDLDEICGGLPIGKFTQFGARPAMGKSQLMKQILRNVSLRGVPTGIVTVEEDRFKIAENSLSAESGVENNHIAYGNLCREEYAELAAAVNKLAGLPLFIMDEPVKLADIESAVTMLAMEYGCRAIAVDYLQLIDGDVCENENREITKISRTLKNTFKRLNVAGMAAVQLNRGNEAHGVRPPVLRDLRGSGSLEQDGDLIILLHREDYYRRGQDGFVADHKLEADIAKNKDGCTGAVPLWFEGRTQTVSNWNNGFGPAQLGGAA